jgi:Replication-relaxation
MHRLTITETYVRLREAERMGVLKLLAFDPVPYSLKWVKAGSFEPDAFARIRLTDGTYPWFIEVDDDTEDRGQMLAKLKQYCDADTNWPGSSRPFPSVLFVVPDDGRKLQLGRWVSQLPEDEQELFYVATLDEAINTMLELSEDYRASR